MRRIAWTLLLIFAFTIPWEYSLDLGAPFGNIARIAGLLLLIAAVPAILQAGRFRRPGPLQWLTLTFYLWLCCPLFWTAAPDVTPIKLRGYFQEMMIVWLIWEFGEGARDVRNVMRVWLAGSWVLAILTIVNFAAFDPSSGDQIRFAAFGQDPNDVARFLDLGFPIAALLLDGKERWAGKLLAAGYLPLGFVCVLLTASRGGFLAAVVALAGSAVLLIRRFPKGLLWGALALPVAAASIWLLVPSETLERIASIGGQLQNGDFNQRVNIWSAGWNAFLNAPILGHGAGSFVAAARLAPIDTAHNTVLSILVEGGLVALVIAAGIVVVSVQSIFAIGGTLRICLATLMAVWLTSSLVGTVGESRSTWLLLALIALGYRLMKDQPEDVEQQFPSPSSAAELCMDVRLP
ncbi:MAG: O-antigen ligase family protein [Terracidiphilus sp.]